jgi:ribosomal protein S6--L-glutamate ligase
MTLTSCDQSVRILLGREAMSGRISMDQEQYLLGQPTSESLKELYQNAEKAPTGVLASNPELYSNK